jgi:tRNA(Arg) A34 adenosine deaminase TadA
MKPSLMDDEDYLREAIRLAGEHLESGHGPFGAIVVQGGGIVGRGWNSVTLDLDPTAHAEVLAIRDACKRLGRFSLAGCTLYTSCEPCPMCLAAAYWARLERIVYAATRGDAARAGFDDAHIEDELRAPSAERRISTRQLLHAEGLAVLERWSAKADKVPY